MQAPGPGPGGARKAWPLQSACVTHPINKLALLKTAVFVLNVKLWRLLINAWSPLVDCSSAGSAEPPYIEFYQAPLSVDVKTFFFWSSPTLSGKSGPCGREDLFVWSSPIFSAFTLKNF